MDDISSSHILDKFCTAFLVGGLLLLLRDQYELIELIAIGEPYCNIFVFLVDRPAGQKAGRSSRASFIKAFAPVSRR